MVVGLTELIAGVTAATMDRVAAGDVPPPGAGFVTVTLSVPRLA